MSLSTTTSLSTAQPAPLAYAGLATPHNHIKKTILFFCLPWHSYLLQCGCSLSLHPSWHAPNGSNSSLLLLGGMSSQQDISPQKSQSRNLRIGFPLSPPPDHTLLPLTHDPPPPVLAGYRMVKSGPYACLNSVCVQNLSTVFVVV